MDYLWLVLVHSYVKMSHLMYLRGLSIVKYNNIITTTIFNIQRALPIALMSNAMRVPSIGFLEIAIGKTMCAYCIRLVQKLMYIDCVWRKIRLSWHFRATYYIEKKSCTLNFICIKNLNMYDINRPLRTFAFKKQMQQQFKVNKRYQRTKRIAPNVGIEPTTTRLRVVRSTDWANSALLEFLPYCKINNLI